MPVIKIVPIDRALRIRSFVCEITNTVLLNCHHLRPRVLGSLCGMGVSIVYSGLCWWHSQVLMMAFTSPFSEKYQQRPRSLWPLTFF